MNLRMLLAVPPLAATLFAQQSTDRSTVWTIDASGHRVEGPLYAVTESPTGGERTETVQSINGRMIPVQSTEDRVVSQNSTNKVTERVIRKYDPNGNLGQPIKVRIEETKNPDGSTTIRSSAYEADLNGNQQLFERSTTEVRKNGATTETSIFVERGGAGGLAPYERTNSVERQSGNGSQLESNTYRRDVNGNFTPYSQDTRQTTKSGNEQTTDTAHYELGADGRMALYSRAIDRSKTNPDGSQVTDTDVYSRFSVGKTGDVNASEPRLQEQSHRQLTPGPNGSVIETTSVRARLPSDQSRFGQYETVSKVTHTSSDGTGREVKTSETVLGRRDPNGQIVTMEGGAARTVTIKPPAPPAPPAGAPKQ